jgi:hypothetical protein
MQTKETFTAALLSLAAMALSAAQADVSGDRAQAIANAAPKMTVLARPVLPVAAAVTRDSGLVTIFSNLAAKYPNGEYWCCSGYNIMGPQQGEQWIAAAFTPNANHTVTKIDVAAGWSEGPNGLVVSLNADNKGVPGKTLKTWMVSGLPLFGTCCGLIELSSRKGIPIAAGRQYWVMLSTNDSETDTVDGWNVSDADQVDQATIASYSDNQWHVFQAAPDVAFAVKGSD